VIAAPRNPRPAGPGAPALVKGTGTTWMEEEAPAATSAALEGVVVDGDGKPIDGARVTLSRARGRNEEATAPYSFIQPKGAAVTAGGGRFRIEKLAAGDYRATAMADGWAPAHKPVTIADKQTARVDLKLAAGGLTLDGRVLDIGGGGVGGARVTAFGRALSGGGAPALFQAVSDGDGRYKMTLAKGNYMLRAEAEGYAGTNEDAMVMRATTKDLRMVPAARIAGQVVERGSGQPVPNAEVTLTTALRSDYKPPRDTRADEQGRFEFTALEPGRYEVMGRKGALVGAGEIVGVAVAQTVDNIEVKVDRGFSISGRVKDDRGKGVVNTRVSAMRDTPPWGQAARTRTNSDGSYALEGMLPGQYRLSAGDEGFGPGREKAKLLAANLTNVDIVLLPGSKVTGRVLTAAGQPVEGARVTAMFEMSMGGGSTTATSDGTMSAADGSFELKRAWPGTMRINARHDELGSVHLPPEPIAAGETKRLELRLKTGASISGVVRTEDGKPAPGVRVTAMAREMRMFMDTQDVSGPDGRYQLRALPAARITVGAERSGRPNFGMDDQPNQKSITVADGEQKLGVDLVVGPAGLAIKGMAVDPQGKPVVGALVSAAPERDGRAFRGMARDLKAYSDIDGNFSLNDLSRGSFTVWAVHPEHPEAEAKGGDARSGCGAAGVPGQRQRGRPGGPAGRQAGAPLLDHDHAGPGAQRETGGAPAASDGQLRSSHPAGAAPAGGIRAAAPGRGQPRTGGQHRRWRHRQPGGDGAGRGEEDRRAHPGGARVAGDGTGGRAREQPADAGRGGVRDGHGQQSGDHGHDRRRQLRAGGRARRGDAADQLQRGPGEVHRRVQGDRGQARSGRRWTPA
jgi:protocatechuate 3,4-dioxygenase beta subunit